MFQLIDASISKLDVRNILVLRFSMLITPFPDPDFIVLRESICRNVHLMQRGLSIDHVFVDARWDETRFWDRFVEETRKGAFDGYLRRWDGVYLPDMWRLYRPHFESGRFDDLIRAWARVVSSPLDISV